VSVAVTTSQIVYLFPHELYGFVGAAESACGAKPHEDDFTVLEVGLQDAASGVESVNELVDHVCAFRTAVCVDRHLEPARRKIICVYNPTLLSLYKGT